MAVRSVILALAFLFFSAPSYAQSCFSLDSFASEVKAPNIVLMISNAEASKKLVGQLNSNRAASGKPAVDGAGVIIGIIKRSESEFDVGVAIFDKNHCIIEETVANLTLRQWVDFSNSAGVSIDDFFEFQGA